MRRSRTIFQRTQNPRTGWPPGLLARLHVAAWSAPRITRRRIFCAGVGLLLFPEFSLAAPATAPAAASGVPVLIALCIAALATAASLAAVLMAVRATARQARAEDRRLRDFGTALTEAAREIQSLAAAQSAAVLQAQATTEKALAAATKAGGMVANAEARLNFLIQRAEQSIAAASDTLSRAQESLSPLAGLVQDLPGSIETVIRGAARSGADEGANVLSEATQRLAAAALLAIETPPAAPAWPDLGALVQRLQNATEQVEDISAARQELAAGAAAAMAALNEERSSLNTDRQRTEQMGALLLRLGRQVEILGERTEIVALRHVQFTALAGEKLQNQLDASVQMMNALRAAAA